MKILERDFTGYGKEPPNPNWPKKSRLAINFVINVEEGSEYSPLLGDQKSVIACGGAGEYADIDSLFGNTSVSAAAAGSLFVFHGRHRAVLINYPSERAVDTK